MDVVKKYPAAQLYGYANADVLFDESLVVTLENILKQYDRKDELYMVGKRTNGIVSFYGLRDFNDVRRLAKKQESSLSNDGLVQDYFIVTRAAIPWDRIPDFVVGREGFNPWLTAYAINANLGTLDLTNTVLALHQVGQNDPINYSSRLNKMPTVNKEMIGARFDYSLGRIDCVRFFTKFVESNPFHGDNRSITISARQPNPCAALFQRYGVATHWKFAAWTFSAATGESWTEKKNEKCVDKTVSVRATDSQKKTCSKREVEHWMRHSDQHLTLHPQFSHGVYTFLVLKCARIGRHICASLCRDPCIKLCLPLVHFVHEVYRYNLVNLMINNRFVQKMVEVDSEWMLQNHSTGRLSETLKHKLLLRMFVAVSKRQGTQGGKPATQKSTASQRRVRWIFTSFFLVRGTFARLGIAIAYVFYFIFLLNFLTWIFFAWVLWQKSSCPVKHKTRVHRQEQIHWSVLL